MNYYICNTCYLLGSQVIGALLQFSLRGIYYYLPHFADERIKAQRSKTICPGSHSQWTVGLGLNSKPVLLIHMSFILPPRSHHFSPVSLSSLIPGLKIYILFPLLSTLKDLALDVLSLFIPSPAFAEIFLLDQPLSRPWCDLEVLQRFPSAQRPLYFGGL